jgi:transcription antitermination factor NusA-like protein
MLEKADPETIEEVFNELNKEKVDNETEESYIDVNDTVKDKVYGNDGKLVQSTKQIRSIKIKSKDE